MMTMGVVIGVMIGLYTARRFGIEFVATPDQLQLTGTMYQYIGAAAIAATFALGNHTQPVGIILAGATGMLGYDIYLAITGWSMSAIAASAAADRELVSYLTSSTDRTCWLMLSISTITPKLRPKQVVSMMMLALAGCGKVSRMRALRRWR